MSYLTQNPEVMLEVLAVLVRKAGGSVHIKAEDAPGPFNLLSKWEDDGSLRLALDESLTPEDVHRINGEPSFGTA